MRKIVFDRYKIIADPEKTKLIYNRRGPHLLKCSCPGCQNFFKAVSPYEDELNAALSVLGIAWDKPDSLRVRYAADDEVVYDAAYSFVGEILNAPKQWTTAKNELGKIRTRVPDADRLLNERMKLSFRKGKGGKAVLRLTAALPWEMETLNCIYDPKVHTAVKPLPGQGERLFNDIKYIVGKIKHDR